MGIAGAAAGTAAQKAQELALVAALKRGKSKEQQKVIDFFFHVEDSKGCGCGGKGKGMSMSEYMKLVQDKCNSFNSKARAIEKIGLDESQIQEIPPILLASFDYGDDAYVRVDNRIPASNKYSISWIFFSAEQIFTWTYSFDMTSDNVTEITRDFFYKDITCLRTSHKIEEKITAGAASGCLSSKETWIRDHFVVDVFEIIVPGTEFTIYMRDQQNVEQSIQAAKAMLREKKFN